MFEAGKSVEDVGSWSSSIEEPIAEETKEETKAKQQPVEKTNQSEQKTTKLPELQITKFNGTYEAWLPF